VSTAGGGQRRPSRARLGRYAYVYVFVAYARQPMRMEFHFYRPQEQWVLQQFSYSDDINDDIATFAKYDLIR